MPQLNPEFFVSQLFWLIVTFTFLFIFLWRISLPRISSVLENRENKINDDLTSAKNLQAEAEEIQKKVDKQLLDARVETTNLIKKSTLDFQNYASKKLEALDQELNNKIIESEKLILKNKQNSLEQANEEVYSITKIILSKISDAHVDDKEIKSTVNDMQKRILN